MSCPKIIVFGANGFVGSAIARAAVASGISVIAASSSGSRPLVSRFQKDNKESAWIDDVQWFRVDTLKRSDVMEFIQFQSDASVIISCVGALTLDHRQAMRINGDTNVNIAAAVYERPSIKRFVFISAMPMPPVTRILKGYYHGKKAAERALVETLRGRGAALRPGMVSGTRVARYGIPVPLYLLGTPLSIICRPLYNLTSLGLLVPPIDVDVVAKAALYAAFRDESLSAEDAAAFYEYGAILDAAQQWTPLHLRLQGSSGAAAPPPSG